MSANDFISHSCANRLTCRSGQRGYQEGRLTSAGSQSHCGSLDQAPAQALNKFSHHGNTHRALCFGCHARTCGSANKVMGQQMPQSLLTLTHDSVKWNKSSWFSLLHHLHFPAFFFMTWIFNLSPPQRFRFDEPPALRKVKGGWWWHKTIDQKGSLEEHEQTQKEKL